MVRTHELLVALRTLESLLPSVGPSVPLQFVGSGESFAAEHPVANKWPFSTVPSQMSSEMGGFAVDLIAAGYVANVLFFPGHPVSSSPVHSFPVFAIGAGTGDSPEPSPGGGAVT